MAEHTPRYRPDRADFHAGPALYADELHRLRKLADEALDSIDPAFVGCFGYDVPAYLIGASATPDRDVAAIRGEVGRGYVITSESSSLPAWLHEMVERLTTGR